MTSCKKNSSKLNVMEMGESPLSFVVHNSPNFARFSSSHFYHNQTSSEFNVKRKEIELDDYYVYIDGDCHRAMVEGINKDNKMIVFSIYLICRINSIIFDYFLWLFNFL